MKATITVDVADKKNPFFSVFTNGRDARSILLALLRILKAVLSGGVSGRLASRPTVTAGVGLAVGTVAPAAAAAADTLSVNGAALTATELRANCTVTVGTSVDNDDTVTVNGVVFTAKSADPGTDEFLITGVAATDAAALVACINACVDPLVSGLIEAVRPAANGVVNIYAIAPGTAGNAYTIATSDAVDLAITNDNAGSFAGGAAIANDQFDPMGNNLRTAQGIADAINDSTTALINQHAQASVRSIVVTCASVAAGDFVTLDGVKLKAVLRTVDSGGARLAQEPIDEWSYGSTDTNDAVSLKNCINAHPILGQKFIATNSSGVVTIRELPPEATVAPRVATSDGTRLAVSSYATGGSTTLGSFTNNGTVLIAAKARGINGNAVTTASSNGTRLPIGGSAARLLGGTSTTYTL